METAGIQRMWSRSKAAEETEATSLPDFEALVRRYQSMVYSIAFRFLGDSGRAEEIAQDVFLQLHQFLQPQQELRRLENEDHAVAWLRRVTAHRSIDALRSPMAGLSVALEAIPEPGTPSANGDLLLQQTLRQMVTSLPEKQRIAIVLRYQEDMEPMEIAEVLGMPLATVKSNLRRGLDLMRQKAARLWSEKA